MLKNTIKVSSIGVGFKYLLSKKGVMASRSTHSKVPLQNGGVHKIVKIERITRLNNIIKK